MKRIIEKLSHISSHPLARGSLVVLIGTTVANAGAYAYHLVVGRMLGPQQYGELAALFSFSYFLNVPSLVLQTILAKYVAEFRASGDVGKAKTVSFTATKYLLAVIAACTVVFVPFVGILSEFLHITAPASVIYMYMTSVIWLLTVVQASVLQGLQQFTSAMVLTDVGAFLRLAGGIVGALFGVVETVFAGVVTGLLGFAAYFVPLRRVYAAKSRPFSVSQKELAAYSVPSLLTILGITSLYSADIMLVKHFLPGFDAGLYAALSVMGKIIFFASSSISYVLFPVVAERAKQREGSHKLVYTGFLATAAVSGVITSVYFLLPKLALGALFGSSYFPAAPYLGWFGVFLTFYSLSNLLVTTLLGGGHVRVWLFVTAASLLQIAGIYAYHDGIFSVIAVNTAVTAGLLASLLLYYRHAVKNH